MKFFLILIVTILYTNSILANETKVCQKCHPKIYSEYYKSSHRKASIYNDKIHKAMWDKYPEDKKGYSCAKCHTPSDLKVLKDGKLTKNEIQIEAPISCIYCHTIKMVKDGNRSNTNILTGKKKEFYTAEEGKKGVAEYKTVSSWFGLVKESQSSPYHKIDYTNENYYSGNVCMGCHSHTNNEHSFDISMLDALIDKKDKNTCISCHMPQVEGTKVTLLDTKTHAYHGISGIFHQSEKMGKYIDFKITKLKNGFKVLITNKSNHALFGQVFRQGVLDVEIIRDTKSLKLKPFVFERILGKDGKEVMPWDANVALKDSLIYAKKEILFKDNPLRKGDIVKLILGVRILSKDGAKKLEIKDSEKLTKLKILKIEKFSF